MRDVNPITSTHRVCAKTDVVDPNVSLARNVRLRIGWSVLTSHGTDSVPRAPPEREMRVGPSRSIDWSWKWTEEAANLAYSNRDIAPPSKDGWEVCDSSPAELATYPRGT